MCTNNVSLVPRLICLHEADPGLVQSGNETSDVSAQR